MSTVALAIGLVVGNIIHPGEGLNLVAGKAPAAPEKTTTADFLLHMIPETLFSSLTSGVVLQTLLVALLVGFAIQAMGKSGKPILVGIGTSAAAGLPGPGHDHVGGADRCLRRHRRGRRRDRPGRAQGAGA